MDAFDTRKSLMPSYEVASTSEIIAFGSSSLTGQTVTLRLECC